MGLNDAKLEGANLEQLIKLSQICASGQSSLRQLSLRMAASARTELLWGWLFVASGDLYAVMSIISFSWMVFAQGALYLALAAASCFFRRRALRQQRECEETVTEAGADLILVNRTIAARIGASE